MSLPRIAVTIGDIAGIGPEITEKALSSPSLLRWCRPIVIGDRRVFRRSFLRRPLHFVDIPVSGVGTVRPGKPSAVTGRASFSFICAAVGLIAAGEADGLVTAPVAKSALHQAGLCYPGHTELLASMTGTATYAMLMVAKDLRTAMVTRHLPLAAVGGQLTKEAVVETARCAERFIRERFGIRRVRLGICALNPHAGEGGLLGDEERRVIAPAVRSLRRHRLCAAGPVPGDSAWLQMKRGMFDVLVTMYHDQAMTGLKCLASEHIVNVTAGLPFTRTSPGHGTGFDIAGKGKADPRPMIEAVRLAAVLSRRGRAS